MGKRRGENKGWGADWTGCGEEAGGCIGELKETEGNGSRRRGGEKQRERSILRQHCARLVSQRGGGEKGKEQVKLYIMLGTARWDDINIDEQTHTHPCPEMPLIVKFLLLLRWL